MMRTQRKPKKSDSTSKLVLEEIIGLTTKNANGLSSNMLTGDCVYLAGCVVVVYNVETGNQSHLMVSSRVPKPLTCVAVSNQDGGIVAAGESGHQPAVLVWDYSSHVLIAELKVHRYGVSCIAFSPDGKHLVSVGFPHDGYFCLWDWRNGRLVTKLKSSSSCSVISSVSFSSDAKFFVTVGKKHMKYWTVESSIRSLSNAMAGLPTIDGKSANLGCQKGSSFISVASATWTAPVTGRDRSAEFYPTYALTDTGILCLFGSGFTMRKWVDLKVEKGFSLSVSDTLIACGCNNGVVQLFTSETLSFSGSLQISDLKETHNSRDMPGTTKPADRHYQFDAIIPDAIACQFATSEKLVVVYGDHSLHVWDVRDVAKVSRCSVLVAHSACIWDVKNLSCENMHDPTLACVARGCCGGVSFATCSTDGTIRLWDLALRIELKTGGSEVAINDQLDENSVDTEKVGAMHLVGAGIFERDIVESGVSTTEGFRSMAVSSDGKYLASGDSQGNLHVYNLHTADYTCIQAAHEAEILSLTFSVPSKNSSHPGHYLLASGGKDRMIHLYDVERNFELIESLDDHSAAVTSVKLTCNGCKILSCSADRSLVFRDVAISDIGCNTSRCHHQLASNGTVYDMAIDPATEVAVTVGQDKKINTFSISSGKLVKTFKQDRDFGEPIKVSMDPSSSYLVCSYSNKSMCIYDFTNGELVTQVVGHGEVITGVIFLPDCKHIVSVGGDGCIFVWKLPSILSSKMLQRMMERTGPLSPTSMLKKGVSSGSLLHKTVSHPFDQEGKRALFEQAPGFRFSISRLPSWAQTKVTTKEILPAHLESTLSEDSDLGDSELRPSDISNNSNSPIADNPSFGMDNRWLTIHTLYHDPLDSPNRISLEGMAESVSSPNILDKTTFDGPNGDENVEIKSDEDPIAPNQISLESPCGLNEHIVNNGQHLVLDEKAEEQCPILDERFRDGSVYNSCENKDPNDCYVASACCEISVEQRDLDSTEIFKEDDTERSHQDNDLFHKHFSNLSSALKTETGQQSDRRSYSARFVVRRDQLTGCKRLFETFNQSSVGELLNSPAVTAPNVSNGDPTLLVLEKSHPSDACKEDVGNPTETLSNPAGTLQPSDVNNHTLIAPVTAEQINVDLICMSEETAMEKRITECKEALLKLDAAAGNTLQLCSELRSVISRDDTPSKSGIEFYDWAGKFLPVIGEKLQSLGEMVQTTSTCSDAKMEDPRFEPLVEKFAQSLSCQVLELVKKGL